MPKHTKATTGRCSLGDLNNRFNKRVHPVLP